MARLLSSLRLGTVRLVRGMDRLFGRCFQQRRALVFWSLVLVALFVWLASTATRWQRIALELEAEVSELQELQATLNDQVRDLKGTVQSRDARIAQLRDEVEAEQRRRHGADEAAAQAKEERDAEVSRYHNREALCMQHEAAATSLSGRLADSERERQGVLSQLNVSLQNELDLQGRLEIAVHRAEECVENFNSTSQTLRGHLKELEESSEHAKSCCESAPMCNLCLMRRREW
eukprot:TRINITY_DN12897_c0_g1_i1.p1 TRINITY_DN12897_c0_g1~~TRINITY_DN12897_c0_g1_i1.p1  ORF type:complete len:233 (-),score=60.83 TRINITY_DN12897_c0_g1_i1:27-725(-)